MIAAWLLVSLPLGGLVVLAASCAAGTAALRGRATRWAWAAGLVALIALVAATPFRTTPPAPPPAPMPATTANAPAPTALATPALVDAIVERLVALRTTATAAVARTAALPRSVHVALGAAWLLASLVTAGTLVVAWRRMRRTVRALPVADVDGTRVRVAPSGSPMVVGLARAEIVVPAPLLALDRERRALVLAHERAHVAARDPWLLVLGAAVVALVPWHPASWWLASRLALAIETDCDARVLAAGAPVRTYGALLLDVAAARPAAAFLLPWPALVAGRSFLETRLMTMTARTPRFAPLRAGVLGLASLALVATACSESKLPTAADVAALDAARATRAATALTRATPTTYVVDGRTVRYAEATAIAADSIVSVDITRPGLSGDGTNVVRITTRRAATGETRAAYTGAARRDTVILRVAEPLPLTTAGAPLYLLDGRRIDAATMQTVAPDRIASIEVLKGAAAVARFGPEAKHGAVMIVTTPAP